MLLLERCQNFVFCSFSVSLKLQTCKDILAPCETVTNNFLQHMKNAPTYCTRWKTQVAYPILYAYFHFSLAGMTIRLHMLGWGHLGMITDGTETVHTGTFDAKSQRTRNSSWNSKSLCLRYNSEYQMNSKTKIRNWMHWCNKDLCPAFLLSILHSTK